MEGDISNAISETITPKKKTFNKEAAKGCAKITDFWKSPVSTPASAAPSTEEQTPETNGQKTFDSITDARELNGKLKSPCLDVTNTPKMISEESMLAKPDSTESQPTPSTAPQPQTQVKKRRSSKVESPFPKKRGRPSFKDIEARRQALLSLEGQAGGDANGAVAIDVGGEGQRSPKKMKSTSGMDKFREFFKKAAERSKNKEPKEPTPRKVVITEDGQVIRYNKNGTIAKKRGPRPKTEEEVLEQREQTRAKLRDIMREKRKKEKEERMAREDLMIADLKPLPVFPKIETNIPIEGFEDMICVLEFMHVFSDLLHNSEHFTQGITFDILERAVTEVDALGILVNIVQILLGTLLTAQARELSFDFSVKADVNATDPELMKYQEQAANYGAEFQNTFGYRIDKMPLDSFTYSDILRYHLRQSGAPGTDERKKMAGLNRGFNPAEDPGLKFVRDNEEIMQKLDKGCLAELDAIQKLKVLRVLVDQLLTCELIRDTIEDGLEKYTDLKLELKKLRWKKKNMENGVTGKASDDEDDEEDGRKRRKWMHVGDMSMKELDNRILEVETEFNENWYRYILSTLGEDRAFRTYVAVHSIPAILVETVPHYNSCIEGGTPGEIPSEEVLAGTPSKATFAVKKDYSKRCTELTALMEALHPKGVRESNLLEMTTSEIEYLKQVIKKCPVQKLNKNLTDTLRKKYPADNFKPSSVHLIEPNLALNFTFRELLLDLEQRAFEGGLGGLQGERRTQWRLELGEWLDIMSQMKPNEVNEAFTSTPEEVTKLADLLMEFAETVPYKYLQAPLGDLLERGGVREGKLSKKLEFWKELVVKASNCSQLFLFLSSLDNSILWAKSMTQGKCKECKHKPIPSKMIRCDKCDEIFHRACVKIKEVPETWMCTPCVEGPTAEMLAKRIKEEDTASQNDSSEPQKNQKCEVCHRREEILHCDDCPRAFHWQCLELKRFPRGGWKCTACTVDIKKYKLELKELQIKYKERKSFMLAEERNENQCVKCGELFSRGCYLECMGCAKRYHLFCADLAKRPKEDWYCSERCQLNPGQPEPEEDFEIEDVEEEEEEEDEEQADETMNVDPNEFDYKTCSDILQTLQKSDHAWPFRAPVSKKDAPDYYKIIKKPMDLSTVHKKLNNMGYTKNSQFVGDVMQMFINCESYNEEFAVVYKEGKKLLELFVDLLDNHGLGSLLSNTTQMKWLNDYSDPTCNQCNKELFEGEKTIKCCSCAYNYHMKCVGVRYASSRWNCPHCREDDTEDIRVEQMQEEPEMFEEEVEDMEEIEDVDDLQAEPVDVDGFDFKACTAIIERLLKDDLSFPFRRPVTKKEAPDYHLIIKKPMDLCTIQRKLNNMGYTRNEQFISDIVLMFRNCETYNGSQTTIYQEAQKLWNKCHRWFTILGLHVFIADPPTWGEDEVEEGEEEELAESSCKEDGGDEQAPSEDYMNDVEIITAANDDHNYQEHKVIMTNGN